MGADEMNVIHGDCLAEEGLRSLPGRSASCVCTDPPYSEWTHAKFGKEQRNDGHAARKGLKFKPLTQAQIEILGYEFARVAQRWIIVFCDDRSIDAWGRAIERGGGRWVRTGYWVKSSPMPQMSGDRPGVGAEPVVIGYATTKGRMRWAGHGQAALWRGPAESGERRVHPNQKPLWLMRQLIELFTDPGDLVLDPFAGSGSTGAACFATGRRFRGWEIDAGMVDVAQARCRGDSPIDPRQPDLFEEKVRGRRR